MADQMLRLQPYGKGAEYLKAIDLSLTNAPQELLILGRNLSAGHEGIGAAPNAQYLSRAHAQVQIRGNEVYLRPLAREKNIIYLNGRSIGDGDEVEMKVHDKLSLLGSLECFNYELIPCPPPSAPTLPPSSDPIIIMDPQDDSGKQKKKKQRVFQFLDDDVIVLNASRPSSLKRASSSSSTAHEEIVLVDD
eukprot:gene48793-59745_t